MIRSAELVQHFVGRGSSHLRKGAARHKIGMVWLYRSPVPVWRRGVLFYMFKLCLPAFAAPRGGGGGGSAPCDTSMNTMPLLLSSGLNTSLFGITRHSSRQLFGLLTERGHVLVKLWRERPVFTFYKHHLYYIR